MLRINDMTNGRVDRQQLVTVSVALSEQYHRSIVQPGDIALTVVGTIGVAVEIDDALAGINLSRAVARIQVGKELLASFARWLFGSPAFDHYVDLTCVGTAQRVLNMADVTGFVCAVPPLPEQAAITAFLDRETGKIDALVKEQEGLIELLKEKRKAVISDAVTKGLNPDVSMKASGVEWLGETPEHWTVTSVGRVCSYLSYGFTNPMPTAEDGPYMLTANDIADGYIDFDNARRTTPAAFEALTAKSRPLAGDVLLTKDGTLGRVALHDGTSACINQSVAILRPDIGAVLPAFLAFSLRGGVYQDRMIYEAGGTTIKHIYISRLAKMPFACPPISEQQQILQHLSVKADKFDTLAAEASRAVELLSERRAALISAAVTGKIDVRALADSSQAGAPAAEADRMVFA